MQLVHLFSTEMEGLPPSTNHAYFDKIQKLPTKKTIVNRILSTEGRAYLRRVKVHVATNCGLQTATIRKNVPYVFLIELCTPDIFNSSYPQSTPNAYKKFDATNRIKLLEDAVVAALGIDDCQLMQVGVQKVPSAHELTKIHFWEVLDAEYRRSS